MLHRFYNLLMLLCFVFLSAVAPITVFAQSDAVENQQAEKLEKLPVFDRFIVNENGHGELSGYAQSGTIVELVSGASNLGSAIVDSREQFTIILSHKLKAGDYQWVLRSTDKDGHSATSLQTASVTVPENDKTAIMVIVTSPGAGRRFISQAPSTISNGKPQEKNFAVEGMAYEKGSLAILGHGPKDMHVLVSIEDRRLGNEQIMGDGTFLLIRDFQLLAGDHIIRTDLMDDAGKVWATMRVPFHVDPDKTLNTQAYSDGKPVDSVRVKSGDTISSIAYHNYGSADYANFLFEANRDRIHDIHKIQAGQILILPPLLKK